MIGEKVGALRLGHSQPSVRKLIDKMGFFKPFDIDGNIIKFLDPEFIPGTFIDKLTACAEIVYKIKYFTFIGSINRMDLKMASHEIRLILQI